MDRLRQRLMGQGQGVDAVPDNLFSQATAAAQAVPQDQQLEAQDETPDTTTDDTTPPAVPPAPDVPPEVAIANSQTNEQADGKTPPTIHMPEDPALRMAGNAQSGGPINPMAPPSLPASSGQSEGPNYAQLADVARRARGQDTENVNRWNLGEGLKEAFAIARGQHYSGRPYGGTLEEPAVEKEQADTQKRIQEYLTRKRQGEIDARQGRLTEAEIKLKEAEAYKATHPTIKPIPGSEDVPGLTDTLSGPNYAPQRKDFGYGTPAEIKSAANPETVVNVGNSGPKLADERPPETLRPLPPDKEALKKLGGDFEGELNRKNAVEASVAAANVQRGFQENQADKAAVGTLADELTKQHIPETLATIGALKKAIAEHGGELPGIGPIAGRHLPGSIDTWLRSDEGNKYRNQVQQLQEAHRVAVTGAGAGPTELAMLNQTIMSPTDTPAVFNQKLDAFNDLVSARFRGMKARATGKQLDQYFDQLQSVKQREGAGGQPQQGPKVGDRKPLKSGGFATWNGSKWE